MSSSVVSEIPTLIWSQNLLPFLEANEIFALSAVSDALDEASHHLSFLHLPDSSAVAKLLNREGRVGEFLTGARVVRRLKGR